MDPLQPGDPDRVGQYRLLGRLGGGGMGQVYFGHSPGGRPVAVKVVRPEYGADPEFRRRFASEVEAARRVGGFYTAHVVDADPGADLPWLVTAYVPGPSLQAAVTAHGPLPVRAVAVLGAGLAEGLTAIHACGLVHRDLKPGNVILAGDGPRVIDFGIARALEAGSGTATGVVAGTPAYMSPEQARGDHGIGAASDVFSLGSVLVFAATGTGPFGRGNATTLLYRIAREEPDVTGVPGGIQEVVTACLAKDPRARPTVAEVLNRFAGPAGNAGPWLPPAVAAMTSPAEVDIRRDSATRPAADGQGQTATLPADRRRRRRHRPFGWAAAVAGTAAGTVVLALGAALGATALRDHKTAGPAQSAASAGPPATTHIGGTPTTQASAAPVSSMIGRIHDRRAGISYARLDAPWTAAGPAWRRPRMFTGGQVSLVQARFNGATFNATSLSGVPRPVEGRGYHGTPDLPTVAARVKTRILGELFTVQHTQRTLASGRYSVAGRPRAWLERIRLEFPQARANGWQVTADTIAILLVDKDGPAGGRLAVLLVSLPDTFAAQGDLDQVLSSVQVP
jgi:hypothetical protein